MSTEAMRDAFEAWAGDQCVLHRQHNGRYSSTITQFAWEAWEAATASQEALIKAALDAAAEVGKDAENLWGDDFTRKYGLITTEQAIRQITPQQVMERLK